MLKLQTIKCVFCQGTGENPHYKGTCPVCRGRGKNQITGVYTNCQDCRGSGRKLGTTLSCYSCVGLGVVADRQIIIKKARAEFKKGLAEMEEEREELKEKRELRERIQPVVPKKWSEKKVGQKKENEGNGDESESTPGKIFCQCCAKRVEKSSTVQVCLDCVRRIKKE